MKKGKGKTLSALIAVAIGMTSPGIPACIYYAADRNTPAAEHHEKQEKQRLPYLMDLPPPQELSNMSELEKTAEFFLQHYIAMRRDDFKVTQIAINNAPRRVVKVEEENVEIIFPLWKDIGNGRLEHIVERTIADIKEMAEDLKNQLRIAVHSLAETYPYLEGNANDRIEQVYPKYADVPNKKIQGTNLTYEDIFQPVRLGSNSHLPKKLIFGPANKAYAYDVLCEDIIVYSPVARRIDELLGNARILAHEMTHNATRLQSLGDVLASNLELEASNVILFQQNPIFFLIHPYLAEVRYLATVYHEFYAKKSLENIIKHQSGENYFEFDEAAFNRLYPEINRIGSQIGFVMADYAYPEYQAMKPFWQLVNNHMKEGSVALEVIMAREEGDKLFRKPKIKKFLDEKKQVIDKIIGELWNSYTMPETTPLFGGLFTILSHQPFYQQFFMQCTMNGFTGEQMNYAYVYFLRKVFLNEGGEINYGAISIHNAYTAMKDIADKLEIYAPELKKGMNEEGVKHLEKEVERYKWFRERLLKAHHYSSFAETAGNNPNKQFDPKLFDPRVEIEAMYNVLPQYVRESMAKKPKHQKVTEYTIVGQKNIKATFVIKEFALKGDRNRVDYIEITRFGESNPCAHIYGKEVEQAPKQAELQSDAQKKAAKAQTTVKYYAVYDKQRKGEKGNGVFDGIHELNSLDLNGFDMSMLLKKLF